MDRVAMHAVRVRGDRPVSVVLGHGIGGGPGQWDAVATDLSRDVGVMTFALAGSADADPALFSPERHSSVVGFADDLAVLCADMGLRGVTYVGHSMSAMAGLLASVMDPGLFSRLVLLNGSARYLDDPDTGYVGGFTPQAVEGLLAAASGDYTLWASGFAPAMMGNADRPELSTEFASSLAGYAPAVTLAMFRAAFLADFRAYPPQVSVPTLVLQSVPDPAVPLPAAQWLADAIPGADLALLDVEGHFPHVARPDLVVAQVRAAGGW